jgi:hypothetical protein
MYMCACEKQGPNHGIRVLLCILFLLVCLQQSSANPFQTFVQEQLCSMMICVGAKKLLTQLDYRA